MAQPNWDYIAEEINGIFHKSRGNRTMMEIAKEAGVSVRMIVRLESRGDLKKILEKANKPDGLRQQKAFARVMAQVASALALKDTARILELALPKLSTKQIANFIQLGITRQQRALNTAEDQTESLKAKLRAKHIRPNTLALIKLDCCRIQFLPFAAVDNRRFGPGWCFLTALARRIVRSMDRFLDLNVKEVPDFRNVLIADTSELVVGFLKQSQREFVNWNFESIPGFRIRMAFLVHEQDQDLQWRLILQGKHEGKKPLRCLVIEDSVADNLIRGVSCLHDNETSGSIAVEPIKALYDLDSIRAVLQTRIPSPRQNVVFICDECLADRLLHPSQPLKLLNLVRTEDFDVPAYPLGIASRKSDKGLDEFMRRILNLELFDSHAAVVAPLYARYISKVLLDTEHRASAIREALLGTSELPELPSYLKMAADQRLGPNFRNSLRCELSYTLRSELGIPHLDKRKLEALVSSLTGLLDSSEGRVICAYQGR